MNRLIKLLPIFALLFLFAGSAHAQGPAGYTKIASGFSAATYADTSCPDGVDCFYAITASNAIGESPASNIVNITVAPTGVHAVTLTWTESTQGVTFNVYQAQAPKAPVLGTPVSN